MKIAGLDIGTTGCKLTVFDDKGKYLGKSYQDYPVQRTNVHEIDAEKIFDAVLSVIKEMAGQYPDIAGIGVTSFGETAVLVGENGRVLLPSMLYTDPRGKEECQELLRKIGSIHSPEKRRGCSADGVAEAGNHAIAAITGLRPHEMYSLPKLMWVRNHRPEIWNQVMHVFLIEDYIVWKLTGKAQIDYSLATRTMAFDISRFSFSKELLDTAGISPSLFSQPVRTGTPAGKILLEVAEKTGMGINTIIVSAAHDQVAAAIGAGAFSADVMVDGAGTVECMTPIFKGIPNPDIMYEGYYSVVPYVIPGTYVCYAFSYTGGALIQWCTDTLMKKEKEIAEKAGLSVNEYLEHAYSELEESGLRKKNEPTGLLVLPHFAGAATPYMDTGSKGAILGLTCGTTAAEIYRACMEGVVYEMVINRSKLDGSGIRCTKMNATSGGAKSALWMQMKADMLNIPITALATSDAGTVGCAMLTGIAAGVFCNLQDAAVHMVEEKETYFPNYERHEKYMKVFERYKGVYDAVRPLMK